MYSDLDSFHGPFGCIANVVAVVDWMMSEYLEMHYPCAFVSADGSRQCMLVKARHQPKGHQDEKGIIAAGEYQAAFGPSFLPHWKAQLRNAIESTQRDFQYELEQASHSENTHKITEERIALDLHSEYINQFFEAVGPASSICSHATCFCCLMDVPTHPLPCGHVLCTACIKAYGKQTKSTVVVPCCPLHCESTRWAKPAIVRFNPAGAGVRILSLDGGGIRGIVQLEVLRAIEQALGNHISVQAFFDLMVGTGTGGLIATALTMKDRTVDSCIDMFAAICEHAFTPRLKGMPIISHIAKVLGSGPKYKTRPLYNALKTAFTDDDELFGVSGKRQANVRVALTAASVTGQDTILLASYRRPEDVSPAYCFERPHDPEMELKTHEAVSAALANPLYFKPLHFHNKTYLDGGLRSPNPAFIADRERRLIWPDVAEPDLFLSLGTGQNRITVLQKLSERWSSNSGETVDLPPAHPAKASGKWRARKPDDVMDCELAWAAFRSFAVKEKSESRGRRFVRFNPDLDREPPLGDSKSEMLSLQVNVRKRLQTDHRRAALRNVAHRLVASCFYLDLHSKATAEKKEQVCVGYITCRFEDGSQDLRSLGRILKDRIVDSFEPFFLVKPDRDLTESFKVPVTSAVINGMTDKAVFDLPNLSIPLRDETKATSIAMFLSAHDGLEPNGFAISGFPRVLLGEQPAQSSKRPARTSIDQQRTVRPIPSRDGDSISLNGALAMAGMADSWTDVPPLPAKFPNTSIAQLSLADLIAQNNDGSLKRTNRFWTYIGNNYMAQHPEKYSANELAKFASGLQPVELPVPGSVSSGSIGGASPVLHSANSPKPESRPSIELEASRETPTNPRSQNFYAGTRGPTKSHVDLSQALSTERPSERLKPTTYVPTSTQKRFGRVPQSKDVPGLCESDFEEDPDWVSAYSGDDDDCAEAQASPVVSPPAPLPVRPAGLLQDDPLASTVERFMPSQK